LGELSPRRDNGALHALTGDSHCAGLRSPNDPKPGWWGIMIGPGKPIDANWRFVLRSNSLGGCMGFTGQAPADPATGRPYGLHFPVATIGDMVQGIRSQGRIFLAFARKPG